MPSGYFTVFGEENVRSDHFGARLSFGDTQTVWARTGYLGFLRRTDLTDAVEVCAQCILCFLSQRYLIRIELFHELLHLCVFRKARCPLCGGSVRWSHGAERYEIPSHWHWNVHRQGTPEYHRVVSSHKHTHVKTKASTLYVNMLISGGNYVDQCNYFILQ